MMSTIRLIILRQICLLTVLLAGVLFSLTGKVEADSQGPRPDNGYVDEVLQTVLARTEGPGAAEFRSVTAPSLTRDRLLSELLRGDTIEYAAVATKPDWEAQLIPIRIPLRKGLQGYRLFFVHEDHLQEFADVETLEDLKALPFGSGLHWSTVRVMTEAGFELVKAETRQQLFRMLELKRFKALPRGVDEIFFEQDARQEHTNGLAVEQHLAIYIPLPTYLFVTPQRPDLAERLRKGLSEMVDDGSLDAIFWKHFGDDIERAKLSERRLFRLPNPNLGPETPLEDARLWFTPDMSYSN